MRSDEARSASVTDRAPSPVGVPAIGAISQLCADEIAHGELPDHQALAPESGRPSGQLTARRCCSGAVARDDIHVALKEPRKLRGEARGVAPAHVGGAIDVAEAVAEQKHVGRVVRPPRRPGTRIDHALECDALWREQPLIGRQLEHVDDVADPTHLLLPDEKRPRRLAAKRRDCFHMLRQVVGDRLHPLGGPVRVLA